MCKVKLWGEGNPKAKGLSWDDSQVAPRLEYVPHLWALPIVKHKGKERGRSDQIDKIFIASTSSNETTLMNLSHGWKWTRWMRLQHIDKLVDEAY
jgi:hypothetical protein